MSLTATTQNVSLCHILDTQVLTFSTCEELPMPYEIIEIIVFLDTFCDNTTFKLRQCKDVSKWNWFG